MNDDRIDSYSGLAQWRAIPEDFVLQAHIDERGHVITERVSLSKQAQLNMPAQNVLGWAEQCARELRQIFLKQFNVYERTIRICSSVEDDGTIQVYLHADLARPELAAPVQLKQLKSKPVKKTDDFIDI